MDEAEHEAQWKRAHRLHIMDGLIRAMDDPHRFLDIMLSAANRTAAAAALQEQFGLSSEQAQAAMNLQFWSMSERQMIRDEADALRG